ncbi:MAG: T9SS type A sorting domain-containing protein [Bacteroidia bacterium]
MPIKLDSNYYWKQEVSAGGGGQYCDYVYQLKASRTKVFNSQTYTCLDQFGGVSSSGNTNYCQTPISKSFVRQDTVLKKVWLYDSINNSEKVLYDFGQNIGDTAKHIYWVSPTYCAIVKAINNVMQADGLLHKVFTYTITNVQSVGHGNAIEGIGYTTGFLDPSYPAFNPVTKSLICYAKIINYPNNTSPIYGSNCQINTAVKEQNESYNKLQIFPNPATDKFKVVLPTQENPVDYIEIYNPLGVLMKRGEFKTDINVNDLKMGLYVVLIYSDQKLIGHVKLLKE